MSEHRILLTDAQGALVRRLTEEAREAQVRLEVVVQVLILGQSSQPPPTAQLQVVDGVSFLVYENGTVATPQAIRE